MRLESENDWWIEVLDDRQADVASKEGQGGSWKTDVSGLQRRQRHIFECSQVGEE